jgi:hypothetical protein
MSRMFTTDFALGAVYSKETSLHQNTTGKRRKQTT